MSSIEANLPDSCSDAQFANVIATLNLSTALTANQKAFYTELLQKQYAQIVIKRAITGAMSNKPLSLNVSTAASDDADDEDMIILREKRKRED
jgi:hypothetical protein